MEECKFKNGDYVLFEGPSRWDHIEEIAAMHGGIYTVHDYICTHGHYEYYIEGFHIEGEALSLVMSRDEAPDYEENQIVILARTKSSEYKSWIGKECEIVQVDREDECGKPIKVKLKRKNTKKETDKTGWFFVHNLGWDHVEIDPITEDEVINILE